MDKNKPANTYQRLFNAIGRMDWSNTLLYARDLMKDADEAPSPQKKAGFKDKAHGGYCKAHYHLKHWPELEDKARHWLTFAEKHKYIDSQERAHFYLMTALKKQEKWSELEEATWKYIDFYNDNNRDGKIQELYDMLITVLWKLQKWEVMETVAKLLLEDADKSSNVVYYKDRALGALTKAYYGQKRWEDLILVASEREAFDLQHDHKKSLGATRHMLRYARLRAEGGAVSNDEEANIAAMMPELQESGAWVSEVLPEIPGDHAANIATSGKVDNTPSPLR